MSSSLGGSSPLTRGAHCDVCAGWCGGGLIPAYAGSTMVASSLLITAPAHPRLRGEHRPPRARGEEETGSSPLTRGARSHDRDRSDPTRLIPAYAGSTAPVSSAQTAISAHPRLRGEHYVGLLDENCEPGSSPLTRGAPRRGSSHPPGLGLIPAYAGSTNINTGVG